MKCSFTFLCVCVCVSVDHSQVGKAVVLVSVTDVNDNAPSFATEYDTFVCEDSEPGQVPTPGFCYTLCS